VRNSYGDLVDPQGRPVPSMPLRHPGQVNHYSKRDYEAFARILKDCKPPTTTDNKDPANVQWASVVDALARLFKEDNTRFDLIKFVTRLHEHEQISAGATFLTPERVGTD
jgi:hypothetical protein